MFEFFDWFGDSVRLVFDFFINTVNSFISMCQVVFSTMQSMNIMLGYIPPVISVSVILVLFITIINYILGRSNQG